MVSRDSFLLTLGFLAALVGYLTTAANPPSAWTYMEWLQFASFLLAWLMGKFATSPLPGKHDTSKVRGPRGWLLPFVLVAGISSVSCATAPAVVQPVPTETHVQAVREQAAKLATATKEASAIAVELRRLAQRSYEAGAISAEVMQQINAASIVASDKGKAFVEFARAVTTEPSLKVTAQELLRLFDELLAAFGRGHQNVDALRAALAAFRSYLGGA